MAQYIYAIRNDTSNDRLHFENTKRALADINVSLIPANERSPYRLTNMFSDDSAAVDEQFEILHT